ncbi:MAG TPA: GH25 family lysozyme [Verrucomicrobiae bacterium]|nr:GH25 family lysozyme [Verrucomicrobiae bacterium]
MFPFHSAPRARSAAIGLAVLIAVVAAPGASAGSSTPATRTLASGATGAGSGAGAGATTDATITRLEGIDVSHWQGTIDWTKVAASGKAFAIIKATDSYDYTDPMYATNHAQAKAAGMWTGAYHFARPDATAGDAVREADKFVSVVNLGAKDLIPALDLEVTGGLTTTPLQNWVAAWLTEVTARTGVKPMIYTSPAFWQKYMGDSSALADAGYKTLWVAHWNVTTPWVPANNWGGHGWTFWQYSNCGTVPGISGCVDLDRYNGADLAPAAYSIFSLVPLTATGSVKQGQSADAIVKILRTNFSSGVALDIAGLPAGTTAAFDANPTTATSAAVTVTTPSDPTATPTGTYPLTITGVADGITRTTKMSLIVADGIPPTIVAPFTSLTLGTLGTTTAPVVVSWGATDPSGVASSTIQRSINAGTWSSVTVSPATARTARENLPLGMAIQQRVRATDTKANTSGWSGGPIVQTLVTQQTSSSVTWSGTWNTVSSTNASGGSVRYSTSAGAAVTYRFTGSSVAWVSALGLGRGSAKVYLDGVYVRTINLEASSGHSRAIVFGRNWAGNGSHTLRIVVAGTAGHPRVDVDAFVRLSLS